MIDRFRLCQAIREQGPVEDADFDSVYPAEVRAYSEEHFTPYAVARRAAELLVTSSTTRVLDVGAGAGKLCLIGALATEGSFFGIEQRAHFVAASRDAARTLGIARVHFMHGNLTSVAWDGFDAFYLYNPFAEHLGVGTIDDSIPRARHYHERYVRFVQEALRAAAPGTRVVTYHGFGGNMPPSYKFMLHEEIGSGMLEFWRKVGRDEKLRNPRADVSADSTLS